MISSAPSEITQCPTCGGPLMTAPAASQPVLMQILFGMSFIVFLIYGTELAAHPQWLWAWTTVQIGLGAGLIRGRLRARKRILRCVRCQAVLR